MVNKKLFLIFVLFLLVIMPNVFAGYSLITDDTELNSGSTGNFNAVTPLYVQTGGTQYASIFKINTTTNSVSSANLTLYISDRTFDSNANFYFCTSNFDESVHHWTWTNYSTQIGTCTWFYNRTFADFPLGGYITFNLTEAVKADNDGIFTIIINATVDSKYIEIVSSEGTPRPFVNWSSSSVALGDLSVYLLTPTNNTINNTNTWNFYYTVNSSGNMNASNCSLWTNMTGVWARNVTNTTYLATNATHNFTGISITNDGEYVWNVICSNGSSYINASYNFTINKDIVYPTISTNNTNNRFFYRSNYSAQFNFSDSNLYRINISVDGITHFYTYGINETEYCFNMSMPTNNLSSGIHTLMAEVADGHTSNSISEYSISKGILGNYLQYTTKSNQILITNKNANLFDSFSTSKQTDRYIFNFTPTLASKTFTFVVKTNKYLDIVYNEKMPYKSWLVSGNNWIDFYMPSDTKIIPTYKRIKDNEVEVTIALANPLSKVSFSSVGDLNIFSYNYSFYVGNYTKIFTNPIQETTTQYYYLNVSIQSPWINDSSALLYLNNTPISVTSKVITTNNSILFGASKFIGIIGNSPINQSVYWIFNITGNSSLQTYNTSYLNQTINPFVITNCTNPAVNQTLQFNYTEEVGGAMVMANASGLIEAWVNPSYHKYFPLKYANNYNATYCIYPETANVTANIQFAFSSIGYNDENYIENGINLLGNTIYSKIIVFSNTTATTAITITLYSAYSTLLPGYTIESYKYELSTNTYTLVDTQKTDQNGQVIINLITGNNEYAFKVKDTSGNLVYTSEKMKLYTTAYTFRLSVSTDPGTTTYKISQFGCPLSFTNSTNILAATYNDIGSLGTKYYLYLHVVNVSNSTLIDSTTSVISATTLNLNVPTTPNYYIGSFYIDYSGDGLKHPVCSIVIDRRTDAQTLGLVDSLLMSAIFIGTLALIGIAIGAEIALILLLVGFVALLSMGLISLGTGYGLGGLIVVILIFIYRLYKRGY